MIKKKIDIVWLTLVLLTVLFLFIDKTFISKESPVQAQSNVELACPSGLSPWQPLVTRNPGSGGIRQYGCVDLNGNLNYVSNIYPQLSFPSQSGNVPTTTIITPLANAFFRVSCDIVIVQAATTSSTLPTCSIAYTDADSNVAETLTLTNTSGANTLGALGTPGPNGNPSNLFAKAGQPIQIGTIGYASSGATPMLYTVRIRLENLQ